MKNRILLMFLLLAFFQLNAQVKKTSTKQVVKYLPKKGEMTILAWYSIQPEGLNLQRFHELKDAGFTHSFSESFRTLDLMQNALDLAQQVGVKLIVSTPELSKNPEATVKRFMKHPAAAGYFLRDEPSAAEFAQIGAWARKIQAVDPVKYCYLNLFPDYAPLEVLKTKSYYEYVKRFDEEVNLPFLSFDYYPIVEDQGKVMVRGTFFNTLETFLKVGQEVNKPFWAFALTTAHTPYPIPNEAHLRFQMYSNLAYGAQGLQYFTFWTPKNSKIWNFHHGPINEFDQRTEIYDYVKNLNKDIQGLSPVFLGAKVISVQHTGTEIPVSTRRLSQLPSSVKSLETTGSEGAIVSHLQNGNREFLVVVNRDIHQKMMVKIELEKGVERVMKDGSLVDASAYANNLGVAPGDLLVYSWLKK
ncbi:hypothetical protein ACFRAE_01240 [Sphingobacterium sp. HJSM2_6]|uniref:hypothetical protein n=1 Tax=Sphingobacterium sp. HJSM2_6 TaxID=3366264 RepID=UPI003BBA8879